MADLLDLVSNIELNEERFLGLLEKLIGESESLQNSPSQGKRFGHSSRFGLI
jgi:hypothetical protein